MRPADLAALLRRGAYAWRCGAPGPKNETGRRRKCNRAPGHPGVHAVVHRRTFAIVEAWDGDE